MATVDIPKAWLERVRAIALALPEATEVETWDHPTFRVRKKIFTGIGTGPGDVDFVPAELTSGDITTMSMKAAPGEQASLLAEGFPFFLPKYVGSKGWIGIVITDDTDWDEVAELVADSYRTIAPKTLAKLLDPEA